MLVAVIVRVCDSFAAPEEIPVRGTNCRPESSTSVRLEIVSSVGGSLTALTVTVKLRVTMLLEVPPSSIVTVIVDDPTASGYNRSFYRARLVK